MTVEPLRILAVSHVYPPEASGLSEAVAQIATRLASRGHRVEVATEAYSGSPRAEILQGVPVHRFDVHGNEVTGLRGEVREFVNFLEAHSRDLIWINGAQIWPTDIVLRLPGLRKGTVVLTLQGLPSRQAQGGRYSGYYDSLASTIPHLGAMIGVSHTSGEVEFCSDRMLPPPTIIPNGAEPGRWSKRLGDVRGRRGIGDAPWVVSVANHSPQKDHRKFFRVLATAQGIVPGTRGTIIGRHHAARKLRLGRVGIIGGCWYECTARARFARGVDLLAKASRDEVIAAVQQADVFLLTSTWEGSSVALIEAMSAGTAWISTPVGSATEESGGIVVSDEAEMVKALHTLLIDRNLRTELGDTGRRHAQQYHDWDVIANSYERLFEEVRAANG